MIVDLEALKAAALAAGGGKWTATDGVVWFDDGDSALIADPAHASPPVFSACDNIGAWPEAITSEDVAAFASLACPAAVLALIERLERAERVPLPVGAARVLQIRRAHASAKPTERNPAWLNSHRDMAVLFQRIDELEAELRRIHVDQAESVGFHLGAQAPSPDCWKCHDAAVAQGRAPAPRMILCPNCGNKRCPKASDHDLACTGSNEPGQPGSRFRIPRST